MKWISNEIARGEYHRAISGSENAKDSTEINLSIVTKRRQPLIDMMGGGR